MYIDPETVINQDKLSAIRELSICIICQGIIFEPVQCIKCENCFCKNCAVDWKKRSNSCPYKCGVFDFKESKFITRMLDVLIFKCMNGCEERIQYTDLSTHYDKKCKKRKLSKENYLKLLTELNEITYKKLNLEYTNQILHSHKLSKTKNNINYTELIKTHPRFVDE